MHRMSRRDAARSEVAKPRRAEPRKRPDDERSREDTSSGRLRGSARLLHDNFRRQHRHHIAAHLGEAAFDAQLFRLRAILDTQFALAQAAYERGAPWQYA